MGQDKKNSSFDLDYDSEMEKEFYKNIDKMIGDFDTSSGEVANEELGNQENQEQEKTSNYDTKDSEEYLKTDNTTQDEMSDDTEPDIVEDVDDELNDISASLARQISEEIEQETAATESHIQKRKFPKWVKIQSGILVGLFVIVCFGLFLAFTKPGNNIIKSLGGQIWAMSTNDFEDSDFLPSDLDNDSEIDNTDTTDKVDNDESNWGKTSGTGRHEDYAYNILLLGEEAIGSGSARGRTDLIIIATLNTKEKSVKLTSLMRDSLVKIPGYLDNRLNSAYEKGGVDLLYETIELNYDIKLDGCVLVNFDSFETIIDRMGGLELTLTENEAQYLRTTNYISNPLNRDVEAGTQLLNGNQVLGYSRVRYVPASTGNSNDYGRTDRHRIVLNAIFEKYKSKSMIELGKIMISVLPMIQTDITKDQFEFLLDTFLEIDINNMDEMRIPVEGAYSSEKVRGMQVLVPDFEKNTKVLHEFIFGVN